MNTDLYINNNFLTVYRICLVKYFPNKDVFILISQGRKTIDFIVHNKKACEMFSKGYPEKENIDGFEKVINKIINMICIGIKIERGMIIK